MSTFDALADLPLRIASWSTEDRCVPLHATERHTTTIHLSGAEHEGIGEDVNYTAEDHPRLQAAYPDELALAGEWTLATFSAQLDTLDLFFGAAPSQPAYTDYRRWAFESAALDLALRQAGEPLHAVLDRPLSDLNVVVSMGLGAPPSLDPLKRVLDAYDHLHFKVDAGGDWDDAFVASLAELGHIDTVDLKGHYRGTPVDTPADPELYVRIAQAFPNAWIEDAWLDEHTTPALEPFAAQLTWDAPIHSIDDVKKLAFVPRAINMKPSRCGSLQRLFDLYDYLFEQGIKPYSGGQWELGCGRGQTQYLAAMFHPDAGNDIAPHGYSADPIDRTLPHGPIPACPSDVGFRWGN